MIAYNANFKYYSSIKPNILHTYNLHKRVRFRIMCVIYHDKRFILPILLHVRSLVQTKASILDTKAKSCKVSAHNKTQSRAAPSRYDIQTTERLEPFIRICWTAYLNHVPILSDFERCKNSRLKHSMSCGASFDTFFIKILFIN